MLTEIYMYIRDQWDNTHYTMHTHFVSLLQTNEVRVFFSSFIEMQDCFQSKARRYI